MVLFPPGVTFCYQIFCFHIVKPLMAILALLPMLCICEKPDWKFRMMHLMSHTGQHLLAKVPTDVFRPATAKLCMGLDRNQGQRSYYHSTGLSGAERLKDNLEYHYTCIIVQTRQSQKGSHNASHKVHITMDIMTGQDPCQGVINQLVGPKVPATIPGKGLLQGWLEQMIT